LIQRARGGDEVAFQALFDEHVSTLRRYARRWLPDHLRRRVSVADVLQEANIAALARCADFEDRGDASFRNWLLKIVEHKVRRAVRTHAETAKRAVGREAARDERPATGELIGQQASPSQMAIAAETAEIARAAMLRLPERYREVLDWTQHQHLTLDEIASRTGRSRGAARKLVGRALERLATEFEREGGGALGS